MSEGYSGTSTPDTLTGVTIPAGGEISRSLEYARAKSDYVDWGGFLLSFYAIVGDRPQILSIAGTPAVGVTTGRCSRSMQGGSTTCTGFGVAAAGERWSRYTFPLTLPDGAPAELRFTSKDGDVTFTLSRK